MRVEKIPLANLRISENRNYGGEGDIKILAEDIKTNGLINPITVLEIPKTGAVDTGLQEQVYEVIAGRRRVRAVTLLGLKEISCRILEGDEIDRAEEIAGAENINRMAMHPLDEAAVFKKLLESGDAIEELAKRFDRKVSEIWQRVQLLDLYDGIKELFRDGKLTLLSAAILKGLDEERQIAFYEKFKKSNSITEWDVKGFVSKARHDKLYPCITGKDCAKCKKRTVYNDKALFPELSGMDDSCLDHDCYIGKWKKLLSDKIKTVKEKSKNHAGANIIACDDENLFKILSKTLTLDKTEYTVVNIEHNNRPAEKPNSNTKPCFVIDLEKEYDDDDNETGEILTCVPLYWREPEKKKEQKDTRPQQQNPFMPAVKLLEVPEEEAKQTLAALMSKTNPKEPYTVHSAASDIERKVKSRIFDRLIDIIARNPKNEDDTDRFLNGFIDTAEKLRIVKKFAGSDKIPEIKKLPLPKLFAALYASTLNSWRLPDFDKLTVKNEIAAWAGVTGSQLKEMYKEELKLVMPKPAETKPAKTKPAATKTTAQKKPAAKKPVAKKNVKGKGKK